MEQQDLSHLAAEGKHWHTLFKQVILRIWVPLGCRRTAGSIRRRWRFRDLRWRQPQRRRRQVWRNCGGAPGYPARPRLRENAERLLQQQLPPIRSYRGEQVGLHVHIQIIHRPDWSTHPGQTQLNHWWLRHGNLLKVGDWEKGRNWWAIDGPAAVFLRIWGFQGDDAFRKGAPRRHDP